VQPVQVGKDFVEPVGQLATVPGLASWLEQRIFDEHESLGRGEVAQDVAEGEGILLMAPLQLVSRDAGSDPEGAFPDSFVIGQERLGTCDFHNVSLVKLGMIR
jgi:hypothetical protein